MACNVITRSVARTHPGEVRETNQDSIFCSDPAGLYAVCDGMGGLASGDLASTLVMKGIARLSRQRFDASAIKDTLRLANLALRHKSQLEGEARGMGTTVALLHLSDRGFHCTWVGDSRVYLLREGTLRLLTHDHRFVQELVDQQRISADDARKHPRRNWLTRAVGTDPELEAAECTGDVAASDIFVLTSDGVTDVLTDGDIQSLLRTGTLDQRADAIVENCLSRGAPDNVSIVLAQIL